MSPRSLSTPGTPAAKRAATRMAVEFGQQIREARARRAWTMRELARRAGVSVPHVSAVEAGTAASIDTCARLAVALGLRPDLTASDPTDRRTAGGRGQDLVHAAMGEVEAARLGALGFSVALDEPYQHYQFAGRADVVAWDLAHRALLHIENRTQFPNVQEALGSFGAKRAYLGGVLAERLGIRSGWASETHVISALWSSEVIHVLRRRAATFAATCPDPPDLFEAWWNGRLGEMEGSSSSLVLFDPSPDVREAFRFTTLAPATRPRYRDYADAAERLRT